MRYLFYRCSKRGVRLILTCSSSQSSAALLHNGKGLLEACKHDQHLQLLYLLAIRDLCTNVLPMQMQANRMKIAHLLVGLGLL